MYVLRQLNLYGFKRLTRGKDRGGYYHELFLRERKELSILMTRTKVKGTGCKAANNPEAEPDFYSMPIPKAMSEERSDVPTNNYFYRSKSNELQSNGSLTSLSSSIFDLSTLESIEDEVNCISTIDESDEKSWSYTNWLLDDDLGCLVLDGKTKEIMSDDSTTDESGSSRLYVNQVFAA